MEPLTTHETNECTREKISYSDSAYEITNFDEEQSENSVEKNGALRSFRFSATSEMTVFSAGSQSPEPNATVAVSLPGIQKFCLHRNIFLKAFRIDTHNLVI